MYQSIPEEEKSSCVEGRAEQSVRMFEGLWSFKCAKKDFVVIEKLEGFSVMATITHHLGVPW